MFNLFGLRSLVLFAVGWSLLLDQATGDDDSFERDLEAQWQEVLKDYEEANGMDFNDEIGIEMLPTPEQFSASSVLKFAGIIFGVTTLLFLVGLTCCCCLPCCLLSKRRRRGQTHGPATALEAQPMAGRYPTQAANTGFRQQQQGYPQMQPQQPGYPSQQPGYPSQQPGCPPMQPCFQDNPPPYPGPPLGQAAAEPYPTKQPAFNPNAV